MFPILQVGQEHTSKASFYGQLNQFPIPFLAQFTHSLPKLPLNVICHPLSMNVLLTLRVASTLHEKFVDMETSPDDMELHEIKAEVYETWAGLNRAFEQIISAVGKLHKLGVLSDDYVQDQETITNDLWAKVNTQILKKVSEREEDDRNHYGKMRATIERRIRGRQ